VKHRDGCVTVSVLDRFGNVLGIRYNRHYPGTLAARGGSAKPGPDPDAQRATLPAGTAVAWSAAAVGRSGVARAPVLDWRQEVAWMKAITRKRAVRNRSGQVVLAVVAILIVLVMFLPALLR
jgi:hypothetical protein